MKNLTEYVENDTQVWISDGDKKVLGQVRPFEEHCDKVLKQVEEIWIESPMLRNDKEQCRLDLDLDQVQGLARSPPQLDRSRKQDPPRI